MLQQRVIPLVGALASSQSPKLIATSDSIDREFCQLPLDGESKLLTTFVISFGRYSFNRLPFGTKSAPEIFQSTMSEILKRCRWRNMANG